MDDYHVTRDHFWIHHLKSLHLLAINTVDDNKIQME